MTNNIEPLDPDEFRTAMRRWATGVTIVTAQHDSIQHGMTVSSFTSISLEPPLVMVSLGQTTKTIQLIHASGFFGVSILAEDQQRISDSFAGRLPEVEYKFDSVDWTTLTSGSPLLVSGLASFDCRVISAQDFGMQTIFIGEVVGLRLGKNSNPLIYFERDYHQVVG
ncbi:MAG TPA: flavin reductase family protein [Anaerolineales bacterium]|nr:flavin reductase family protein [Anaerolineales bacterium]